MVDPDPEFSVALARTEADLRAAQRLRYRVFVAEMGGDGADVDHEAGLERDHYDPFARHLLLRDLNRPEDDKVVGVYRLMTDDDASRRPGFCSAGEYDLGPLLDSGRPLMELGRSCLHPDYRGGTGMYHLWRGLADLIDQAGTEILFGVASFHGTDPAALAQPLSLLYHHHLASPTLRVRSRAHVAMDMVGRAEIDRPSALRSVPALIKAYLRLGGMVGDGAFVDDAFNTVDVCLIVETARLKARQRAIYAGTVRG